MQMLTTQSQSPPTPPSPGHFDQPRRSSRRKRKADVVQDGERERLSKRLSLLRLEQSRQRTYDPVDAAPIYETCSQTFHPPPQNGDESTCMQLDDSKHRVFIHNIDDELSSSSDSESEAAGKLVFLPDIDKHLRQTRIPRHILANKDGQLAGMQMVLYRDPKSISVPEEQDGVRKAVIESRQRLRERQKQQQQQQQTQQQETQSVDVGGDDDAMELD